ncbi:FAD-binding oxidoreductase [Aspergillus ibericus CBS 121593]|uniref:FAD binding domain protein n=1 Tax=Aspergillus ibericus CBS 121593 TaxID=1448316 RepID=A0A395GM61_9EURO|nr:FAD binding domain protein [Aspergillus ibericus CBS 121593]RAK96474.1 FAD binding domain protein [Aspergillus ibericus CBS 121593]
MQFSSALIHLLAGYGVLVYGSQPIERPSPLNGTVSENCHRACASLSNSFGPDAFHYPYDDSNFTIWDAKQQEVRPACRVEPSTASDVSNIINTLVSNWCHFAVKGGGHSRNPGDSNSIGGVTVDLDRMTSVEILEDGNKARVGGGATSYQVYAALDAHNLSFVGGRVGTVGVGGFTLGGGTSPFSNKYGWALDNVYEYEVVLSNGTIVTASESRNPDLYFALRGGGNNFGVVTAFTVRTFAQGPVSTTLVTYASNQTEQVLDRIYDLFTDEQLTDDVNMGLDMFYTYSPDEDSFTLSGTQRYARPIRNPPVFSAMDQIPALTRFNIISNMSSQTQESEPLGVTRHLFATLTVSPSRPLLSQAVNIFEEEVRAISAVEGLVPNLVSYALSRNAIAAMKQRGGNALGIQADGPLLLILISTAWSDADGDIAVNTMTGNTIARIQAAAESLGVANRYLYINYASAQQEDEIFPGYGEENERRLKEIQRAVDPRGVYTSQGLWRGFVKLL